jgi:hypothetical protein
MRWKNDRSLRRYLSLAVAAKAGSLTDLLWSRRSWQELGFRK